MTRRRRRRASRRKADAAKDEEGAGVAEGQPGHMGALHAPTASFSGSASFLHSALCTPINISPGCPSSVKLRLSSCRRFFTCVLWISASSPELSSYGRRKVSKKCRYVISSGSQLGLQSPQTVSPEATAVAAPRMPVCKR